MYPIQNTSSLHYAIQAKIVIGSKTKFPEAETPLIGHPRNNWHSCDTWPEGNHILKLGVRNRSEMGFSVGVYNLICTGCLVNFGFSEYWENLYSVVDDIIHIEIWDFEFYIFVYIPLFTWNESLIYTDFIFRFFSFFNIILTKFMLVNIFSIFLFKLAFHTQILLQEAFTWSLTCIFKNRYNYFPIWNSMD